MKGHLGAILTTGLAAIALALAVLQAAVIVHGAPRHAVPSPARVESNRFSAPGGRSGIPWLPFDEKVQRSNGREGRKPAKPEEHPAPPPPRQHNPAPSLGPRPPRRVVA
jgi:hypothetical protein